MKESKFYRLIRPLIPRPLRPLCLKYQEYLSYLVFGVLTTLVNLAIFYPLQHWMSYLIANVIAWIGAVIFAYVVNRVFVFESQTRTLRGIVWEVGTFFAARLLSLGLEEAVLYLMIDCMGWPAGGVKLFAQALVIVANYFASKFLVFRGARGKGA